MVMTVFEQSSQSILPGLILCILAAIILVALIILSIVKKINIKTVFKFSCVSILVFFIGIGINTYQSDNISKTMIQKIEKSTQVKDLNIVNNENISCLNDYQGSINAVMWKEGDKTHIGVLIGKEKDNTCVYQLASTITDN